MQYSKRRQNLNKKRFLVNTLFIHLGSKITLAIQLILGPFLLNFIAEFLNVYAAVIYYVSPYPSKIN